MCTPSFFIKNARISAFLAKKCKKICTCRKKAVPLHPLAGEGIIFARSMGSMSMVVLAQLVEHRIVVPSVVGRLSQKL